jgi:threonine dehydrogenase-like Zn-dependent dehydrogenase
MKKIVAKNQAIEVILDEKPQVRPSYLLLRTLYTVISPGTELTMLSLSENKQIDLGYSGVGIVEECGEGVEGYKVGDVVACYGAPYVRHSEYMLVPKTLCSKVPDHVDPKEAALGGIGAIAIHALRVANLQFGERVVVAGLGVIGQIVAQIANAAAYDVYAYDLSKERTDLLNMNMNVPVFTQMEDLSRSLASAGEYGGADAVLLCAGGKRSILTEHSLKWIRDKGKVVIVGDIEPDFPRNDMFAKEAQILISRAGGPGRYDQSYEKNAVDYPYGFVRWTEGRNVGEFIRLVSEKKINVSPYVGEEVAVEDIKTAFESLQDKNSSTLTKVIKFF